MCNEESLVKIGIDLVKCVTCKTVVARSSKGVWVSVSASDLPPWEYELDAGHSDTNEVIADRTVEHHNKEAEYGQNNRVNEHRVFWAKKGGVLRATLTVSSDGSVFFVPKDLENDEMDALVQLRRSTVPLF